MCSDNSNQLVSIVVLRLLFLSLIFCVGSRESIVAQTPLDFVQMSIDLANRKANDSSFLALESAQSIVNSSPNPDSVQLVIWRVRAALLINSGQADSSFSYLSKGLDLIRSYPDRYSDLELDYVINLGSAYASERIHDKAIPIFQEALTLARIQKQDTKRSKVLNNLGIIYRQMGREAEALHFYEESLDIKTKGEDSLGMANTMNNMSYAYLFLENYEKAGELNDSAKNIYRKLGRQNDFLSSKITEGRILFKREKYEEAERVFAAVSEAEGKPSTLATIIMYLTNAGIQIHKNNMDEAGTYLSALRGVIDRLNNVMLSTNFYELDAKFWAAKSNYKKAYESNQKYIVEYAKLANRQSKALRVRNEIRFLSAEKDFDIALLQKDKSIAEFEADQNKRRIYLLLVLLGMAVVGLVVGRYFYNKIKRQKELISKANEQNELLLKEIHHRVKNNLQVISALLTLQSRYIDDEDVQDALMQGNNRIESMALIHKELYQHDNLKAVNAQEYMSKLVDNISKSYYLDEKEIRVQLDVEPLWLDVETMIPLGLTVNELLANSMKYAFDGRSEGNLFVRLHKIKDELVLHVGDDGVGASLNDIVNKKSFGYSLINSFARKLNAELKFDNNDGLKITLKIKNFKQVA